MQKRLFLCLVMLALPGFLLSGKEKESEKELPKVIIEESRTRVFFFSVYLTVGEVVEKDKQLQGEYGIRVPSSSSDNEGGKVVFDLETPLKEIVTKGGTIKGKGFSTNPKHPERIITCEFKPDSKNKSVGKVRMTVDTGERVLRFDADYKAVIPE